MLIYLGRFNYDPMGGKLNILVPHYSCKYHNKLTGKCDNYANRPEMCEKFPNGHPCPYEGATYMGMKEREKELDEMKERLEEMCKPSCLEKSRDELEKSMIHDDIERSNLSPTVKEFLMRMADRRMTPKKAFTLECKKLSNGYLLQVFAKHTLGAEPMEYAVIGEFTPKTLAKVFGQVACEFGLDPRKVAEELASEATRKDSNGSSSDSVSEESLTKADAERTTACVSHVQ